MKKKVLMLVVTLFVILMNIKYVKSESFEIRGYDDTWDGDIIDFDTTGNTSCFGIGYVKGCVTCDYVCDTRNIDPDTNDFATFYVRYMVSNHDKELKYKASIDVSKAFLMNASGKATFENEMKTSNFNANYSGSNYEDCKECVENNSYDECYEKCYDPKGLKCPHNIYYRTDFEGVNDIKITFQPEGNANICTRAYEHQANSKVINKVINGDGDKEDDNVSYPNPGSNGIVLNEKNICKKSFVVPLDSKSSIEQNYLECFFGLDTQNWICYYHSQYDPKVYVAYHERGNGNSCFIDYKSANNITILYPNPVPLNFGSSKYRYSTCEEMEKQVIRCETDNGGFFIGDRQECMKVSSKYRNGLNYDSLCDNNNIKKVFKVLGVILRIVTFIGPLIMIILGIVDFAKVIPSSDEKALYKAINALARRFLASIAIVLSPTILFAIVSFLGFSDKIEDESNGTFGTCTVCLLKPNECTIEKQNIKRSLSSDYTLEYCSFGANNRGRSNNNSSYSGSGGNF